MKLNKKRNEKILADKSHTVLWGHYFADILLVMLIQTKYAPLFFLTQFAYQGAIFPRIAKINKRRARPFSYKLRSKGPP